MSINSKYQSYRQDRAFARITAVIFAGLLLIGLGLRIYGAWQLRHNLNPDAGIVALMAKHIAEGKDFPVFFYGQAYMGSLEPCISALFCVLFGTAGFMVTLGTALVGWLVLFAVYFWARDAHSPLAGLAAVAYCVIGPLGFFHYQISPRGGYAVTILLSTLVLWLGARLISGAISRTGRQETLNVQRPTSNVKRIDLASMSKVQCWKLKVSALLPNLKSAQWFLLGLLAGLGWWSNQLIVSSILTTAILGLVFLRRKIFSLNTILAAVGFFTGSLPFWRWNFLNDWQSFALAGSLGSTPLLTGLRTFFIATLPGLLDLSGGASAWRIARGAAYGLAAVLFIFYLWKALRGRERQNSVYLPAVFLFFVVSALIFSTSHFAQMDAARYLLPLVPAMGVVLGVATAELVKQINRYTGFVFGGAGGPRPANGKCLKVGQRRPRRAVLIYLLSFIPLLVVIVNQAWNLSWLPLRGAGERDYQSQIEECGRLLESRGTYACYAPYKKHAWNFALKEKICFCDLPEERYLPYVRRAELADRIAVIDNLGGIDNFIANYGGTAEVSYSRTTPICHSFKPPREGLAAILPGALEAITDSQDENIIEKVYDGNLDTGWESAAPRGDDEWLEIVFKRPQEVGMVRLLYRYYYPETWQLEGQTTGGDWKTLTPCVQTSGYLWSGPRPYWSFGMDFYRLECRIPPEKFRRIRIHRIEKYCRLREIQLFTPASARLGEDRALKDLLPIIKERGIKQLYCYRWPANAVYRETKGDVQTSLDPVAFGDCSLAVTDTVSLTPQTALLVRDENAPLCRQVLADRLVEARQTTIGPWVLFDFSPDGKCSFKPEYGNVELHWAGFACLAKNNKKWAAELVRRADILIAKGETNDAAALLKKACRAWPRYQPAVERLAGFSAEHLESEHNQLQPEIKTDVKFDNGVAFAGLSLSTNTLSAGDVFTIKYFWKYPESGIKGRPCVFVHFLSGENILQDDHLLENFNGADYQPYPEYFIETRRLVLPQAIPEGEYRISIGLYDASRKDQRRFNVRTDLPHSLNSVELPAKLTVGEKEIARQKKEKTN